MIFFVIAVLLLAAVLIFWKPGKKTKYRFVRLSLGNLLIHLMDGLITYVNTPDLQREGNPLVSRLGYGWGALFLANAVGFAGIVLCAWWFCRYEHVSLEATGVFDYFMKLLYGEDYKVSWIWYKIPRNRRATLAISGYGLYWGLTMGAPIFVIGWILDMLEIDPPWWKSTWIAFGIALIVCFYCMYLWAREGYRCTEKSKNVGCCEVEK